MIGSGTAVSLGRRVLKVTDTTVRDSLCFAYYAGAHMSHFARQPDRRGLRFWFPLLSAVGVGFALWAWALQRGAHGARLEQDLGLPGAWLPASLAIVGVSMGTIVGLLNPWVASRLAACITGMLAVFPPALFIAYAKQQPTGDATIANVFLSGLVTAAFVGGLYGLAYYRPGAGPSSSG